MASVSLRASQPPASAERRPLSVLVADDDRSSRLVTAHMLKHFGCRVVVACDGEEAIRRFEEEEPDCVLLDVWMPRMDGLEACRRIKAHPSDRFVPVMFVTSLASPLHLESCVDAGGDDFITKPVESTVLGAKMRAMERIRQLHDRMREQREILASQRAELVHDRETARAIFARILAPCTREQSNLRLSITPADAFNGDLVLAEWTPHGTQHVLVGDFAGHGLRAALGAIPAATLFHGMTRLGFEAPRILEEMNRKLRAALPSGLFLAACLLEIDPCARVLGVWNGGIPGAFLVREGEGVIAQFESGNLPLGVMSPDDFSPELTPVGIRAGDHVFVCSDGLLERANGEGEMFGLDRLAEILATPAPVGDLFDDAQRAVEQFAGDQPAHDDCTFVDVECVEHAPGAPDAVVPPSQGGLAHARWALALELEGAALRAVDPIPALARTLLDFDGLDGQRETLLLILSELFSNAVEHGLLGLPSSLKCDPDGFASYYALRYRALQKLASGFVRLALAHEPTASGRRVRVRVEDSGQGFDHTGPDGQPGDRTLHGRGIPLVRGLCRELRFEGRGNRVEAVYEWAGGEATPCPARGDEQ